MPELPDEPQDLDDLDESVLADWQDTVELPLLPPPPPDAQRGAGTMPLALTATLPLPLAASTVLAPRPAPPRPPVTGQQVVRPSGGRPYPGPWAGPWSTVVVSDRRDPHDAVLVLAWVLAVLSLGYLLPWAVAATRGRSNHGGIALVNVLLGWTGLGWAVALVMACSAHRTLLVQVVVPEPAWPQTAAAVPFAARVG